MDRAAALGLAWYAAVCVAAVLVWTPPAGRLLARLRYPLVCAAGVAFVVQLVPALLPVPHDALIRWDHDSYRAVAAAMRDRRNVYDLVGRYPYLPLHVWLLWAADRLATLTPLSFITLVKLPAVLANVALAVTVGACARASGRGERATTLALAAALNPVALLVTSYHGQIDVVPAALALAAWGVLTYRRERWALPAASLLFGLAVADKTWPVLLAPVLLLCIPSWRDRGRFALLSGLPAMASLAVYEWYVPGGALHALKVGAHYQGMIGVWGYSGVMVELAGAHGRESALAHATAVGPFVFGGALLCAYFAALRLRDDLDRLGLVILIAYVTAAGWGLHWTVWLTPFALLTPRRWGRVYLAVAGVYTAIGYFGFGAIVWGFTLFTSSLAPARWPTQIGLVVWAGLTGAAVVVLGRCLGDATRSGVRWLLTPPALAPGRPDPVLAAIATRRLRAAPLSGPRPRRSRPAPVRARYGRRVRRSPARLARGSVR